MARKQLVPSLFLILCWILQSSCVHKTYSAADSLMPSWNERYKTSEVLCRDSLSKTGLTNLFPCHDRWKRSHPTSIADKLKVIKELSSTERRNRSRNSTPSIFSRESEKIVFSRKYSPIVGADENGFVPVPGPYGFKTRFNKENALKTLVDEEHKAEPAARSLSSSRPSHNLRHKSSTRNPQNVQRRAQYRFPKILDDDLEVKDSISSESILGNGNFEIIRGGIFSDQDANEILGSRRMGRGYGSYSVPQYRQIQNQFLTTRNVQFPAFYQGSVQNQLSPLFYPRAPY